MSNLIDDLDDLDDLDNALLERKRHDDIVRGFSKMATALSENNDKEVVNAINKQGQLIGDLVTVLKNIPKPEKPVVNVDVDIHKHFSQLINKICCDIVNSNELVIRALDNRMLPDTFDLIKFNGVTNSVKVNYKEASKIIKNT